MCWVSDYVPSGNKMIINNLYLSEVEFSAQLLLGPILVRYLRITGQILVRKMDYFGEQISLNAHNRHCTFVDAKTIANLSFSKAIPWSFF